MARDKTRYHNLRIHNFSAGRSTALLCCSALPIMMTGTLWAEEYKYQPRLELATTVGTERYYGEVDLLVPLLQNEDTVFFLNGRGILGDQDSKEGNIGLGIRRIFQDQYLVGAYSFFDRRQTRYDNYFNQLTIGAELITARWEIRANGYFPEKNAKATPISAGSESFLTGNGLYLPGNRTEKSLTGFDAEVGGAFPGFSALRFYAGGFYFSADQAQDVSGPRGRIEWQVSDYISEQLPISLSLNGMVQDDQIRGTTASAELRLRVPFGGQKKYKNYSYVEKRMTGRIQRDADVMTGFAGSNLIPLIVDDTKIWYVKNNASAEGDGSYERPFLSLKEAENAAHADDVIYIYSGDGTTAGQNAGIILKDGQHLIGNGVDFILGGKTYIAAGDRPLLSNETVDPDAEILYDSETSSYYSNQDNAVIEAHNNVLIDGVSLRGESLGSFGIRLNDKTNVTIKNVDISGFVLPSPSYSSGGSSYGLILTVISAPAYLPDYYWNHHDIDTATPVMSNREVAGIEVNNTTALASPTILSMENVDIHDNAGSAVRLNIASTQTGHHIELLSSRLEDNRSGLLATMTGAGTGDMVIRDNTVFNGTNITINDTNTDSVSWDITLDQNSFSGSSLSLVSYHSAASWTLSDNDLDATQLYMRTSYGNHNSFTLSDNIMTGNESQIVIIASQNTQFDMQDNIWKNSAGNGLTLLNLNSTDTVITTADNQFLNNAGNGLELYNQNSASLTLTMARDIFTGNGAEGLELDNFTTSQLTASLTGVLFENNTLEAIEAENEGTSVFTLTLTDNNFNNSGNTSSMRGYSANTGSFTLNLSGNQYGGDQVPDLQFGNELDRGLCFGVLATCAL